MACSYGFSLPSLFPVLVCEGMPKSMEMDVTSMVVAPNSRMLFAAAVGTTSKREPLRLYAFALPSVGEQGLAALEEQLHSYR